MKALVAAQGKSFVNAIHLQCYSGGSGNIDAVSDWTKGFNNAGGDALMIPGLATNQSSSGPWWHNNEPGGSVQTVPNVAMYDEAKWHNYLYTQNFPNVNAAFQAATRCVPFGFGEPI